MTDLIGDTSQFTTKVISFGFAVTLVGSGSYGDFLFSDKLKRFIAPYASVEFQGPISVAVHNPRSVDKAPTVRIGCLPTTEEILPTTSQQIACIGGALLLRDTQYSAHEAKVLTFGPEIVQRLKPKVFIGTEPRVVYQWNVSGGTDKTEVHLEFTGNLSVSGVGYIRPYDVPEPVTTTAAAT